MGKYPVLSCALGAARCRGGQQRYPGRVGDNREGNYTVMCCWGL